jgi:hypothetical protein
MTAIGQRLGVLANKLMDLLPMTGGHARSIAPAPPSIERNLDRINEEFHTQYGEATAHVQYEFPVFVLLAESLVVFHAGQRQAFSFSPRAFHVIKSIAHAPVALFVAFQGPSAPEKAQLEAMRRRILSALALPFDDECLSATAQSDLRLVLHSCRDCIDAALRDGSMDRTQLDALAARLGEPLQRLLHEATSLQLHALHDHTERALHALSPSERRALRVVVTGNHQARIRSFAMQYFKKRMSASAHADTRLSYAEGVSDEQAALALVGIQQLDRKLARAFFGEETRLQRDLLGDAAEDLLRSFELAALD